MTIKRVSIAILISVFVFQIGWRQLCAVHYELPG